MEEQPGRASLLLEDLELEEDEELWTRGRRRRPHRLVLRLDRPFPCPAAGCTFVAEFMTAAHLILVWEERDDPNLLRHAERAMQVGRNPRVVSTSRRSGRAPRTTRGRPPAGRCTASGASEPNPSRSLGVEEELLFVDAETLRGRRPASRASSARATTRVKPELFESFVELTTPALPDAPAVLAELRRRGRRSRSARGRHGLRVYAAGSHPLAPGHDQELVPLPRYEQMAKSVGAGVWRQLVCGLHVHVSVDDPVCACFEAVVPWLPVLLALSANSPFSECEDTGFRSARRRGACSPCRRAGRRRSSRRGRPGGRHDGDSTRRHWDAWPRPEYGTLEVRVMDMQTDVRRAAGFAAIVQRLVASL